MRTRGRRRWGRRRRGRRTGARIRRWRVTVVGGDVVESAGVLVVAGVVPAVVEVVEVSTDDPGPDSLHAAAIAASATADTKRRHATRDRLTT